MEKTRETAGSGGVFLYTFPLGYNPGMDAEFAADSLGMKIFFLKRSASQITAAGRIRRGSGNPIWKAILSRRQRAGHRAL
jgi:hypothetical protein